MPKLGERTSKNSNVDEFEERSCSSFRMLMLTSYITYTVNSRQHPIVVTEKNIEGTYIHTAPLQPSRHLSIRSRCIARAKAPSLPLRSDKLPPEDHYPWSPEALQTVSSASWSQPLRCWAAPPCLRLSWSFQTSGPVRGERSLRPRRDLCSNSSPASLLFSIAAYQTFGHTPTQVSSRTTLR